jgi:hypothetical protein
VHNKFPKKKKLLKLKQSENPTKLHNSKKHQNNENMKIIISKYKISSQN